jgi:phosphoglycolate phosphatase
VYKLVIFDFDGTLADSAKWFAGELNPLAARFGFRQVTEDEVERLRGFGTREILKYLRVPPWKVPAIAGHLQKRMAEDAGAIQLFPGAKPLLRKLACTGMRLGIVSSNAEANVRRILGDEASALVEHYECGASLLGKTSRFRRMVKRAGVSCADTLCIGDEARDIEAAKAAGLPCAAVVWGYAKRELLMSRRPTWVFESPDEIAERLAA